MGETYAQISKPWRQTNPFAGNKKFRRLRRRCQTNQSRKIHPLPNIGAYKIPHLQSQILPTLHPTNWKEPHQAIYKSIHATDIPANVAQQTQANDNYDEISTSPRGLCKLYINFIARKLSKPEDGCYRSKHVDFHC
jgi:hypothetical protein